MIKLATLFWLVLVSVVGFAMFAVKYQVQSLEDELNRARKDTLAEEHAVRMDEVEWAFLTRPEALEALNQRHMALTPIATTQLRTGLADIPLRPPPPPPIEETVVSAAPLAENGPAPAAMAMPPEPSAQAAQTPPPLQLAVVAPPSASEIAKPMAVKAPTKAAAPRRPKTLDDLIAQIVASR